MSMHILAIDTSSQYCSVAVMRDGSIVSEVCASNGLVHSKTLMPMVETALANCSMSVGQIDLFACAYGPGSFTGVRIAVSTIKGLALPGNKPCVGVNTLQAAAAGLYCPGLQVCPVLDARREQVYTAVYKDGIAVLAPCVIPLEELMRFLLETGTTTVFTADGLSVHAQAIQAAMGNFGQIAPVPLRYQRAAGVALEAMAAAKAGQTVSCFELDALYLRKSQAEREYEDKHGV